MDNATCALEKSILSARRKTCSVVALAAVAQWTERRPKSQKVAIPSQGTGLGCRPDTLSGAHKKQLIDVSLAR